MLGGDLPGLGKSAGFMKALAAAFTSGEPGTEINEPDGTRIVVDAPDAPGVARVLRGESDDGPWKLRVYNPAPTVPPEFPDDHPFIPDAMFTLMNAGERMMMTWIGFGGPAGLADTAIAQSLGNGWVEEPATPRDGMPNLRQFRRGGRVRSIFHATAGPMGYATLWEAPA